MVIYRKDKKYILVIDITIIHKNAIKTQNMRGIYLQEQSIYFSIRHKKKNNLSMSIKELIKKRKNQVLFRHKNDWLTP